MIVHSETPMLTTLFASALFCFTTFFQLASSSTTCLNVCGGVPVMYPFGTGKGCGSLIFEQYINCTNGRLLLFTPTGKYYVQSIDYSNNLLVIQDPRMSTCKSMQISSGSFGIPVGAPFSLTNDRFVLLGCSPTSSLYNPLSTICDPAGTQICRSLYSCSSITNLGLPVDGPPSSCCVYSSGQIMHPPYELNLALLQCTAYTSIYSFYPQNNYGGGVSNNDQDANSWSYGIILEYYYDESAYYASCRACQQTSGVCAFNIYGFVCVCSAGVNTTTHCIGMGDVMDHATRNYSVHRIKLWIGGLSIVWHIIWLLI